MKKIFLGSCRLTPGIMISLIACQFLLCPYVTMAGEMIHSNFIPLKHAPEFSVNWILEGTVLDANGLPIPSATIAVKGKNRATVSDLNGKFKIQIDNERDSIVVSSVGYITSTTVAGSERTITIVLAADLQSNKLNDVVVVGYGTQKKANITGSIATITSKDLTVVPAANTSTLLAGKLPGLIAVQRSGEPGNDNPLLSIRGFDNALVVVDGIVGRDFSRLDPNEIESISILKDAASASVYGVSGGNGVIIVTTKKGVIGKPEFTYNYNYGVQHVTRYPDFVNAEQFAILKNEASTNLGGSLVYTPEEVQKFRDGTDPNYPNFNYYDYFVRDYTPQQQQNITVRGGNERIKYFFLLGALTQESMWKGGNQDFGRYNFRSNIEARITDDIDIAVDFGARSENRDNLVQDSYLMSSWMQYQWPIFNPKTPDGKISSHNYGLSAYLDKDLTGYIKDRRNLFQGNLSVIYRMPFIQGLSARITAARDMSFRDEKHWHKQYGLYNYDETTQTSTQTGARELNFLNLADFKTSETRLQGSLNYARRFSGKHNVDALLLYEEAEADSSNFYANRINYVLPIDQIFAGPDLNKGNGGGASDNGRQSVVGRVNYDYNGRYILGYSFRYDGSAKFPVDKRWGYFSGVNVGWRISEENFFKGKFNDVVDNLKLRATYGKLGSDNTGNFQFLTGYTYPAYDPAQNRYLNYVLGGNVVTAGLVDAGVPNPNITWEESKMLNLGVDVGLWNRLLEIEFDVFHRKRTGLLAKRNLQLPSSFGATLPFENLNSDQTQGFELVLHHTNSVGEINYNISGNVSFTKSKWDHVEQREFTSQDDSWRYNVEGRYKNRFFGLKSIGQFQSQEEINTSPIQDGRANSTLRPGDYKYEDLNKDGTIDANDNQPIGRGDIPEINYGLTMNASFKKISVQLFWQGAANFQVRTYEFLNVPFNNDMNSYAYMMDRWHRADITDPNSAWIPGKYPSTINNGAPNNNQFSSQWLENATYIRLKALNIGYNISNAFTKRLSIKNLNVFVSGQNLITITGLDYIDPETPSGRLSIYPQQKTYNAGFNITF